MSEALCTFYIPYAPYHHATVDDAVASVDKQTIKSTAFIMADTTGSPAYWRNHAMQATTPFISFLDADDTLEPYFLDLMLAYWKPGHYVYSDFLVDGRYYQTADNVKFTDGTSHLVNVVMSREAFIKSGGFTEGIPIEDTEYFLRARCQGLCGIRSPHALVNYNGGGQRSQDFQNNPNKDALIKQHTGRYYDMAECSKCGGDPMPMKKASPQQPTDILCIANWNENVARFGAVTGRRYPKAGHGMQVYVDPQDQAAAPHLWLKVDSLPTQEQYTPDIDAVAALMKAGLMLDV